MLNWRSKTLSFYAGDTALPGGKIDDDDKTIEDTAVRSVICHSLVKKRCYFYVALRWLLVMTTA